MSIVLVATVRPAAEHRDEVIAAFAEAVERVHEEPGCELYALHTGPDRLVMIEKWSDGDALKAHNTSPALTDLQARLAGRIEGDLDVQVLQPYPAGTQAQGAL